MAQITAIPPARGLATIGARIDTGALANAGVLAETAAGDRAAEDRAAGESRTGDHETPLRILLSPPDVGEREREAMLAAFDSNWISTVGPAITEFERAMEARLGRPCVALSSGTAALHLALRLAGVGPGDVVMCQSLTFVASANPILYEGAEPCFVDSEAQSWNMDPDLLDEGIRQQRQRGERVAAVMAVHLYGVPAAIRRIADVCARHEVPLIEDAAEALGAEVEGSPVGRHGMASAFSFNGNKIITTAGGGMLALRNEHEAAQVRKWSAQSREAALHYEHAETGYNYRMSNLLAALGSAQLGGLDAKVARRRAIAQRYREGLHGCHKLHGVNAITMQAEPPGVYATHWLSCALLGGDSAAEGTALRDGLIAHLAKHGIEARPVWKPMHQQPLFREASCIGGAVSDDLFARGICLPSGSGMSAAEQDEVIGRIREYLRGQ